MTETPKPGSPEAVAMSCSCPILDNAHGKGYMGQPGIYVYTEGCPVHDPAPNNKHLFEQRTQITLPYSEDDA